MLLFKHGNRAAPHQSPIFWCLTRGEQIPLQTSQELDLYLQEAAYTPGTLNDSPEVTEPGSQTPSAQLPILNSTQLSSC